MDFFASDAFLTALARDYHRAKKFDFKVYELHGKLVRLAEINGSKAITSGPFYDYIKPFAFPGPPQGAVSYIPKLVTSVLPLDDQEPAASVPATIQDPSPLVKWDRFATWEDYQALLRKRSKNLLPGRGRKLKKLVEQYGEPAFSFDNPDIEALDLCIRWKVQQYHGGHETLEDPDALLMLRGLFHDGHLILSTLKVSGQYVAVTAGFLWNGDYLFLLPTYDPAFARYGVGKELLLRMLEHSYRQGQKSFDFLQGAEPYKWDFATHVQIIESCGVPPLAVRARDAVMRAGKERLMSLSPPLFYASKRLVISGRRRVGAVKKRFEGEAS